MAAPSNAELNCNQAALPCAELPCGVGEWLAARTLGSAVSGSGSGGSCPSSSSGGSGVRTMGTQSFCERLSFS